MRCLLNMAFPAFLLSLVNVKQGRTKISHKVFGQFTFTTDIFSNTVKQPFSLGICTEELLLFCKSLVNFPL